MKLNYILALLVFILIIIISILFFKIKFKNELIDSREKTIFGYQSILNTVVKSDSINSKKVLSQLKLNGKLEEIDKIKEGNKLEFIYEPNKDSIKSNLSEYYGMQITIDENSNLSEVLQFKP